ncbi:abortive infection system antitoxin AbiGi family protein [Mycolicibacterium palauense]|uniref:abortive infection system antitoxin AbiGi family protein n=1 Tax=Mycolicibacterium palauense TaxID=2034511 RepID=UPI00159BA91E|nr:abortive infection system antitoxin AbiGi family protein [Mycolicibacterium palauense]
MTTTIADMLHRRNDLSTFLVHFTRDAPDGGGTAFDALKAIVTQLKIEARTAYGLASNHPTAAGSQRVVCFTETPLEHSWTMTRELAERRTSKFAPYGLAFTKTYARRRACNPVWYINQTRGFDWPTQALNTAIAGEIRPYEHRDSLFRITPFIEQMGDWSQGGTTRMKEFWWEREWRRVGDFSFEPIHTVALLAPASDHTELRQTLDATGFWSSRAVPILDPDWGLERMIAVMSGVAPEDLGPFPG